MICEEIKFRSYGISRFRIELNNRPNYEKECMQLRKRDEVDNKKDQFKIQKLQKEQNNLWRLRVQNTQEYQKKQINKKYRSNTIDTENNKIFDSQKCVQVIYSTPQKVMKLKQKQNQQDEIVQLNRSIDCKNMNEILNEKNQIYKRRTLRLSLI
ncbi:unnamed protein product [Paramecium sonneborni]|uniref:Uncharacterized protein n=1 Tax=Paramecium sonneborni TaxID=65129 RepID=A0A8S1L8K1_9CILI|nr:unnamed protein product [Paramecium sonneborni]